MHYFQPKNILRVCSKTLLIDMLADSEHDNRPLNKALNDALDMGYRFYVVDSDRGYCHFTYKVITIPLFALERGKEFKNWYFCHELAHFLAYTNSGHTLHGKDFMNELLRICPKNALHFETDYKPKNAQACGISKSMHVNCGTVPSDF